MSILKAQNSFSGKVIHTDSESIIDHAIVSINHPENQAVLSYTLVNEKGEFKITVNSDLPELLLEVTAMNFEKFSVLIPNQSQNKIIALNPQETILEEIIIKPTLITQRGDTISYDLNKFATKNDRVLEDVLKRIPGIEVEAGGKIKYQGQAINKFYVEGMDLMQGRYASITQAMPNVHVSKLEVLENHQPIKMLDGKVVSDSPAINIKLKRNISVSGSAKIGLGCTPFIGQANITPMFFNKNIQFLANYDANNVGKDVSGKLTNLTSFGRFENYNFSSQVTNLLQISDIGLPTINKERYNFNKTHLASINTLFKLNKTLDLNTSLFYYNNEFDSNGKQVTQIKDLENNNVIEYYKISEAALFNENMKAVFTFTNNTETNFLKNIVTIDIQKNKNRNNLELNNNPILQNVVSPNYAIQNSLSTLIPFRKKLFINLKSILDFTNDKQTYQVSPTQHLFLPDSQLYQNNKLFQHYLNTHFYTQNSVSISFAYKNWRITPQYEIELTNKKLNTNLSGDQNTHPVFVNNLNYSFLKNNFNILLNYKKDKFNVSVTLPIILNSIQLNNQENFNNLNRNSFVFNPTIHANYEINSRVKIRGGGKYTNTFTPLSQLYSNYIFSGLNFTTYNNTIQKSGFYSTNIAAEYKNPFNNIFSNFGVNYNFGQNAVLLSTFISENGQQVIEAIDRKNKNKNKNAWISLGKYFTDLSTNLKGDAKFMQTESEVLINSLLSDVNISSQTYSIQLSNATLNWMGVVYTYNYTKQERKQLSNVTNTYNSGHLLKTELFLIKNQSISWQIDYQESKFNKQTFVNKFMDLKYRYKWTQKRIDFDIDWTNILNTKLYEQVVINNIQTTGTSYRIRPSQILASIRFNF
ncbi:hypothetical protein K5I29_08485 [Flavobacterium agricola]|uniref:Carboxypeptidase-like protein n=1 Tax=Flavobacterium agricola TaxID=2870839 RepID=A0ABY6LZJ1_9FLAO|nr:hypothetical protein [Flavobacterium agricola]UYW00580.1 hypothetical protein K5I29_08485 [Flavobacterium agricola]